VGYPIRAALTANPLTKPLLDGTVRIPGFDWTAEVLDPAELFLRQLHADEFDVFEMSLSTHLRVCSLRQDRWIALPVFTSRKLAHLAILVTERSGISGPSELRGRRIGVPEYQQGITVARIDPRDVFADPPVPGDGDRADGRSREKR
jgi:4,5-dihydroxyphthalate decarboxylase